MKILIDTNIYLDFYRSSNNTLQISQELVDSKEHVIMTEQIIDEFYRNRESRLSEAIKQIEDKTKVTSFSSSIVSELLEFEEFTKAVGTFNDKRKNLLNKLVEIQEDKSLDPVAKLFDELVDFHNQQDSLILTTDQVIESANRRKLVGNPPVSKKYSIGDEIIWESILAKIKDDLIIVGRDNTFRDNETFLKTDFHKETGKLLYKIFTRISDALNELGNNPSAAAIAAEDRLLEGLTD